MWFVSKVKQSGTKQWAQLTADNPQELERAAQRLGAEVHGKGAQSPHLDLNTKKLSLALRLGARPHPSDPTRPQ